MGSGNKIGVVTVTYNSGDVLADFLKSLWAQTHTNFILYAVDNASTDNTMQGLKACTDPRLKVIANPANLGVAEGNNQGIRLALEDGCDHVLLINNDTEFDRDLIDKLLAGMAQHNADMACPKMMYFDEPNRYWAAGGFFQPWLGYRIFQRGEMLDQGQYDRPERISYAPTCCVLIKSSLFMKTGLMDEKYFVYMDDVDFMYRAHRLGAKLMYLPDSKLLHKVGTLAGGQQSSFAIRYCTRNRVYFLIKNFGFLLAFPWLLLYETYLAARLLVLRDNFGMFMFKQKAFFSGIKMLSHKS